MNMQHSFLIGQNKKKTIGIFVFRVVEPMTVDHFGVTALPSAMVTEFQHFELKLLFM